MWSGGLGVRLKGFQKNRAIDQKTTPQVDFLIMLAEIEQRVYAALVWLHRALQLPEIISERSVGVHFAIQIGHAGVFAKLPHRLPQFLSDGLPV